ALSSLTLGGTATLTNASDGTLTVTSSTVNTPLVNEGTLLGQGASALNGTFATAPGPLLRVQGAQGSGHAALPVLSGFTNNGALELTNAFAAALGAALAVTSGALVNAPGASLSALPGALGGGFRTLAAQLDNRGALTVAQALTLDKPAAAHSNSGTIA